MSWRYWPSMDLPGTPGGPCIPISPMSPGGPRSPGAPGSPTSPGRQRQLNQTKVMTSYQSDEVSVAILYMGLRERIHTPDIEQLADRTICHWRRCGCSC